MRARDHGVAGPAVAEAAAPWRVPVRALALATALACVAAQALSLLGGPTVGAHGGPWGVVAGQALWNAAQVGLLVLLLCLWRTYRRPWAAALGLVALASLPFAIYAVSPGGMALSAALVVVCAATWARRVPDLALTIADAPARGTPALAKFELLAFACCLLCSLYNNHASRDDWPYWYSLFAHVGTWLEITADPAELTRSLYSLGLPDIRQPDFVPSDRSSNSLAMLVFVVAWTVLPTLYVLYFLTCARLARGLPWARLQIFLCLCCVGHFLFLTDIVDYRYGRGISNQYAEWAHWAERLAWRIAVLLPIYQKVVSGHLRRGNGLAGVVLHHAVAVWAVAFFVNDVLFYTAPKFIGALIDQEITFASLTGHANLEPLRYHAALVVTTFLYAFMVLFMRCERVTATPLAPPRAPAR